MEAGAVIAAGVEVEGDRAGGGRPRWRAASSSPPRWWSRTPIRSERSRCSTAPTSTGDYRERLEAWNVALAGGEAERGALAAADVHRPPRTATSTRTARWSSISPSVDDGPGRGRGGEAGRAAVRVRRALLPDRLRHVGGAGGQARDERLRPVRAVRAGRGDWDSRREEVADVILDGVAEAAPDVRDCIEHLEVLGPPDIEERIGLTGGQHLPGRGAPGPDVGPAPHLADAGPGALPVRSRHASGRLGDRAERARRGSGCARGRCRLSHGTQGARRGAGPARLGAARAAVRVPRMPRSCSAIRVVMNAGWSCMLSPPGM